VQSTYETDQPTVQPTSLPRPKIRRFSFIREAFDLIILIGVIYVLVNLSTVRFVVHGPSMEPTFADNQYLIVSRVNYLFGEPQRGDIIVFHNPGNSDEDYIKRVIGLPGDVVDFRDGETYVNGERLDEPYINEPCSPSQCSSGDPPVTLGEDQYFVMGDNRNSSRDSRDIGPITRDRIVGEVVVRYWPPQDWDIVSRINFPGN
jgi:signal peptidase I